VPIFIPESLKPRPTYHVIKIHGERSLLRSRWSLTCLINPTPFTVPQNVYLRPQKPLYSCKINLGNFLIPDFKIHFNIILRHRPRSDVIHSLRSSEKVKFHIHSFFISPHLPTLHCVPDLILTIFGREYKLWSSLICNFLHPPVTSKYSVHHRALIALSMRIRSKRGGAFT
jgi:hypothetical protein